MKTLRLRSGQALRLRSGQALRLRSGQALRLRSGQALRLRSGQALRLCSGQALALLIAAVLLSSSGDAWQQQPGRITRIEFRPATAQEGGGVFITLAGTGNCTYTIEFGDGESERRTAELPDRMRHAYPSDGEYLVVATPEAPCEGVARAKVDVRAISRGVWGLSAEPGVAMPDGVEVTFTINGAGECVVSMDYGDGAADRVEGPLPARRAHKYAKGGTYEVRAVANEPCRGEAALKLEVSR